MSSPGYKAPTPVFIKGGDGGRGISSMLSMELCDPSNQKKVRDPLTVHSVLSVSFNVGHQSAGHFRAEQPTAWMTMDFSTAAVRACLVYGEANLRTKTCPNVAILKGTWRVMMNNKWGLFKGSF